LDVVEKGIAPKLAVKDEPSCNNKGAMDGVVHMAMPEGSEIILEEGCRDLKGGCCG
jgi:hypothetical protein